MTHSRKPMRTLVPRSNGRVAMQPWALALALVFCAAPSSGFAAPGDDFDLTWHTIDGGGGTSTGGGFELTGTIGQHDAGAMSGGEFTIFGGFWVGGDVAVPPCPGDLDKSGAVGVPDLLILLGCWGSVSPECEAADMTADETVGVPDLLALLSAWGTCQ